MSARTSAVLTTALAFALLARWATDCAAEPLCAPQEVLTLSSGNSATDDRFGCAIATSGDSAIVGALGANVGIVPHAGAAYAYVVQNGIWYQIGMLYADAPITGSAFGTSVAIDGDDAFVGQFSYTNALPGRVYVFKKIGGDWWIPAGELIATERTSGDHFGEYIVANNGWVAVTASAAVINGSARGAVYLFKKSNEQWEQIPRLPSPIDKTFGRSVAMSGDTLVVGGVGTAGSQSGAAFVFQRQGDMWEYSAMLSEPAPAIGGFGASVGISGDTVLVGAPGVLFIPSGVVYEFERQNGSWIREQTLNVPAGADYESFGRDIGLAGNTVVVGQSYSRPSSGPPGGSRAFTCVHLFAQSGDLWTRQVPLFESTSEVISSNRSIALMGHVALVGMPDASPHGVVRVCSTGCPVESDWDGDGDVDVVDFANLTRCLHGPGAAIGSDCGPADLNGDDAVDLRDFAVFSGAFGGGR